jgi:uncharacterized protein (DUF1800 family)
MPSAEKRSKARVAANRLGLGAAPGELDTIAGDPHGWLVGQLRSDQQAAPASGLLSSSEYLAKEQAFRTERRQRRAKQKSGEAMESERLKPPDAGIVQEEARARLADFAATAQPFLARLTAFWCNHFAVSADKPAARGLAGSFEREAIRPNVLGRFEDLLLAVERHPAMLRYLDNVQSIGPDSPASSGRARKGKDGGLNENLAREILELHTLGVDGGYTQGDILELARSITGWSVGGSSGFLFRERTHQPGHRTVLGKRYAEAGAEQGSAILKDLARHPATARHLARKLARHLVADDPPPALVDRLAATFEKSGGALPAVYRSLVDAPETWSADARKFKSPHDFVVSALRAAGLRTGQRVAPYAKALALLGQQPFTPGSPAGWADTAEDWIAPDALWKRLQVAELIAEDLPADVPATELAVGALGDALRSETRTAMGHAESPQQAIAIFLASPEFQWRSA